MYEIELKYRLIDLPLTLEVLRRLSAVEKPTEQHQDTYYQHPCKDFASTGEALRIRRCDGIAHITYKGPKALQHCDGVGGIKLRRELEWSLAPGDFDGSNTAELLQMLGFTRVAEVTKQRRPFSVHALGIEAVVALDAVVGAGNFVELEVMCLSPDSLGPDSSKLPSGQQEVVGPTKGQALETIAWLSKQLGVGAAEPRSYLRMVLEAEPSA